MTEHTHSISDPSTQGLADGVDEASEEQIEEARLALVLAPQNGGSAGRTGGFAKLFSRYLASYFA